MKKTISFILSLALCAGFAGPVLAVPDDPSAPAASGEKILIPGGGDAGAAAISDDAGGTVAVPAAPTGISDTLPAAGPGTIYIIPGADNPPVTAAEETVPSARGEEETTPAAYGEETAPATAGTAPDSFAPGVEPAVSAPTIPEVIISESAGFIDVSDRAFYAEPVAWAVRNAITLGTSGSTFSPDQTCTKAEILTFLWRAAGMPEFGTMSPFTDVQDPSAYYYNAALWAYVYGMEDGTAFLGDAPCTRASTVTYLWKLAGSPQTGDSGFTDVPYSAPYAQAVAWAVMRNITAGTSVTQFSPNSVCTRGEIVTFLYRAFGAS